MKSTLPCEECDEYMVLFNKEKTVELGSDPIDADGKIFPMWKVNDCDASTFHVCPECNIMAVTCNTCGGKQCQLVGHDGISSEGTNMERQEGAIYGKATETAITEKSPRFNIDDLNKVVFKMEGWKVQGHFWYCKKCDTSRRFCADPRPESPAESEESGEDE